MKTLPTLTLAVIFAAAGLFIVWQAEKLGAQPTGKPEAEANSKPDEKKSSSSEAQKVLQAANEQVKKLKSVDAKVLVNLNMANYGFSGEGRYATGPENKMLYDITIQLPHTTGRLLEVSDGELLFTRHEVKPKAPLPKVDAKDKDKPIRGQPTPAKHEVSVTRRNLKQILDHLSRQTDPNLYKRLAVDMGLGGLPALLASIDKSMQFSSVKEETLRGRPVKVIQGGWTAAQRSVWLDPKQKLPPDAPLPGFVPDYGRLYIDAETGFPHRIMFLKRIPETEGLRTMVALDFVDVKLNGPVDSKLFVFKEDPDNPARELTEAVINSIDAAAPQP